MAPSSSSSTEISGAGPVIVSNPGSDPLAGNDNWSQATPEGVGYNIHMYNGWLYAGVVDIANGYSVSRTQAIGNPPYTWVNVVTNGGYKSPAPSQYPMSMSVFDGRLYVGTVNPAKFASMRTTPGIWSWATRVNCPTAPGSTP